MRKLEVWKSDWFVGVAVVLLFLIFNATTNIIPGLERWAYDLGVRSSTRTPSERVAVIAIDDQSIANIGRWPWSREVVAAMVDKLSGAGAKVIGNTIFFFEPQVDPGLKFINQLVEIYGRAAAADLGASSGQPANPALGELGTLLQKAEQALNTDRKLAESLAKAGNVVVPLEFAIFEPQGRPDKALPPYVTRHALVTIAPGTGEPPLPAGAVQYPIEQVGAAATGIGYLSRPLDVDGSFRFEPLVLRFFDQIYPSMALLLAARSLNLENRDVEVALGQGVKVGKLRVATDPALVMNTFFYRGSEAKPAFALDSFFDVYSGKIPAEKYRDKIVLIGATATGVGTSLVTPVGVMSPVVSLAHSVSSILEEDFFVVPEWSGMVGLAILALVAIYLIVVLPRLKAGMGFAVTGVLFALLVGTHFVLMVSQAMWLQLMMPGALLIVGHGLLTTKRFLVTEKGKMKSEAESAESNRMLGLAFQGQGQLDMAFDKFRKVPVDDSVMDLLYNLGLDFERKRQFNKAQAVYEYMGTYNRKFRDLEQKLTRAKSLSETVILGGGGARSASGTMILEGGAVEKPMLGRYQVEKELGKGAMGVVYLGKDPKISRVVAIKTMALSQEFEGEELEEAKSRFFREAETAGRLSHPNIVTIYDAGEDQELAYIAMELLKGQDLVPYTKAPNLLPLPKLLSIMARVSDALGYAHAQSVVHRDIKPANIMYEADSDLVKVTDFGIARITDSSKTKTGMVLGTPSYMSPEQLAGKKIDGRSDLFSLGATMYQLACGKLPFEGESMAQLMFRIANEPPTDIRSLRPDLPPCLILVIAKALAKNIEERYQTGDEMARAIRSCATTLG